MKVKTTTLTWVLLVEPEIFEDFRGEYIELYNDEEYSAAFLAHLNHKITFVTDDISVSSRNVLRGIHSDSKAWKLISCLLGRIYVVIVNCDTTSANYGKWESFILSERNRRQILVPPNHGVAHLVLSDKAIFHYKQSENYDPKRQKTYRYDDTQFIIWWPIKNPLLSRRDERGQYV